MKSAKRLYAYTFVLRVSTHAAETNAVFCMTYHDFCNDPFIPMSLLQNWTQRRRDKGRASGSIQNLREQLRNRECSWDKIAFA